MSAPTQVLVIPAASHDGSTPDTGVYPVEILEIDPPVDGSTTVLGADVPAGAMVVPLAQTALVQVTDFEVQDVGEEPVILVSGGALSLTIAMGIYAGTYTTDCDGAPLTVASINASPLCIVRPALSDDTDVGDTITITPGLWVYGGPDPGDQSWQQQLDGTDIPGGIDLDYVIQEADRGKTFSVRESFGGATADSIGRVVSPFDPIGIAGLAAWFDAADAGTITANNGRVSEWRDKSGQDHHVLQGSDASRPVTGQRTINGLNALDFPTGSVAHMERNDALGFTGNQALTVFVVAQTDSLPSSISSFAYLGRQSDPTGGACVYFTTGTGGYSWRYNDGNRVFGAANLGTPEVLTWSKGNTSTYGMGALRINGGAAEQQSSVGGGGETMALEDDRFLIGANLRNAGTLGTNGLDAAIAEILIYDTELSSTEMNAVLGYLAQKWSLSVSPAV